MVMVQRRPANSRDHLLGTPHDSNTRTRIKIDECGPTVMGISALRGVVPPLPAHPHCEMMLASRFIIRHTLPHDTLEGVKG